MESFCRTYSRKKVSAFICILKQFDVHLLRLVVHCIVRIVNTSLYVTALLVYSVEGRPSGFLTLFLNELHGSWCGRVCTRQVLFVHLADLFSLIM